MQSTVILVDQLKAEYNICELSLQGYLSPRRSSIILEQDYKARSLSYRNGDSTSKVEESLIYRAIKDEAMPWLYVIS